MRSCKNIKAVSLAFKAASVAAFMAILGGCSDDQVAGNSAETGSPELAGVLMLDDGKPASNAHVQCVPRNFDATSESLSPTFTTEADDDGYFHLDSVPAGVYALEAYHEESGKRFLMQNIKVVENDSVAVNETLVAPGSVELYLYDSMDDDAVGVATVLGTTIVRKVVVRNSRVLVDSLPTDTLSLLVYFEKDTVDYNKVFVSSDDTVRVAKDSVTKTFVAPLALPKGSDSLQSFISDIPLALRLTSENCDFDSLAKYIADDYGRWEVVRISHDGKRSKKLPIAKPSVDTLAKEAVFWVSVDSLNVADSLELFFDSSVESAYALDVFPTNHDYGVVYHFDSGLSPVEDAAEKSYFVGTSTKASMTDGVVGRSVSFTAESDVVVENSASLDTTRKLNLVFDIEDYFGFSVWVQLKSLDKEQYVFEKFREYALRYVPEMGFVVDVYHIAAENAKDKDAVDTANYKISWASGEKDIRAGEWAYVAFSKSSSSKIVFYVNGRNVSVDGVRNDWVGDYKASNLKIGGFAGKLDELMLGGGYRNASWNYLTYLNQRPENYWPVLKAR